MARGSQQPRPPAARCPAVRGPRGVYSSKAPGPPGAVTILLRDKCHRNPEGEEAGFAKATSEVLLDEVVDSPRSPPEPEEEFSGPDPDIEVAPPPPKRAANAAYLPSLAGLAVSPQPDLAPHVVPVVRIPRQPRPEGRPRARKLPAAAQILQLSLRQNTLLVTPLIRPQERALQMLMALINAFRNESEYAADMVAFYRGGSRTHATVLSDWLEVDRANSFTWASMHYQVRVKAKHRRHLRLVQFADRHTPSSLQIRRMTLYVKGWMAEMDDLDGHNYKSSWLRVKSNRWNFARFFRVPPNLTLMAQYLENLLEVC